MNKAEQKWLSMEICPKCGKDLRTHRDHAGYIDQAICINDNCNFKYSEATNDSKAIELLRRCRDVLLLDINKNAMTSLKKEIAEYLVDL